MLLKNNRSFLCLIAPLLWLLSGCVSLSLHKTTPTRFSKESVATRQQQLTQLTAWNIQGAFSFQRKGQASIANYAWQEKPNNHYTITLESALNLYSVTIEGQPGHVTLLEPKKKVLTATSPEALLQQRLSIRLPVQSLIYWIRGLPTDAPYQARFDDYGHLIDLTQQGWHIQFSHYTTIQSMDLPSVLQITGHGQKIKIVIKSWSV